MGERDERRPGVGERVGGAIGGVLDRAVGTVGQAGRTLAEVVRLPGLEPDAVPRRTLPPGTAAGLDHVPDLHTPPEAGQVRLVCTDFSSERIDENELALEDLSEHPKPAWATTRWLRVEGLNAYVVNELQRELDYHTLAGEDVLHVPQRPRVDGYEEHVFVVLQLLDMRDGELASEQVSMFIMEGQLVTFHERASSTWQPIEVRLRQPASRLRSGDASYLAYALLDTIVDHAFPVMEGYAERLGDLEEAIMQGGRGDLPQQTHAVRRELAMLRRLLWPTRELISELRRSDEPLIQATTREYLGDVEQHCAHLADMLETLSDLAASLTDLALSISTKRMNEIMQVLTVIATIFIPITFLAGVYGMNFRHLPELQWRYGYLAFWGVCAAVAGGLLLFFRHRGWFGGD